MCAAARSHRQVTEPASVAVDRSVVKKMWCLYTMELCSAIKKNEAMSLLVKGWN